MKQAKEYFYQNLSSDKIKINWNKNPIKMDTFLSFLKIDVEIQRDHLGCDNGWTKRTNSIYKLDIAGGIIAGIEYLDSLQYGKNLDNPYNNYVSPFYMFDVLDKKGRQFFLEYYKDEIKAIISKLSERATWLDKDLNDTKTLKTKIVKMYNAMIKE